MTDAERRIQRALFQIQQQLGTGEWSLHAIQRTLAGDRNEDRT